MGNAKSKRQPYYTLFQDAGSYDKNVVYLYHFERPYVGRERKPGGKLQTASHRLGSADSMAVRHDQHFNGQGSPLIAAALDDGIRVILAGVIPCKSRYAAYLLESKLLRQHKDSKLCPICALERALERQERLQS